MRIWLSRPHMGGGERELVDEVFASNFVAPVGPMLSRFEAEFAAYLGEDVVCCAVASGTAAMHLALRLSDVGKDDIVWTTSMTFAGGVFPILYEGAVPVFFDLSTSSWTLCPDLLEQALKEANANNRLPKAIVPTDLYGQSVDLDRFEDVCRRFDIRLIVDSAESCGATYKGRKAGTGGDAAILSFNGNKIITTSGGGMLVSRDRSMVERATFLATQAREPAPHYQHETFGYNYRLSGVCAAIGLGQLRVLDERVDRRRRIGERYRKAFGEVPGVSFMPEPKWSHSTRWLTAITIDRTIARGDRERVRLALLEREIESRPLWKPMHMQPLFAGARYIGRGLDERLFAEGLTLPSGSDMSDAEQDDVIGIVRETLDS